MSEQQVNNVLNTTIEKIKQMVDVNTVIGDMIRTEDGTTIIPVSKISYGFASGGSDLPSKKTEGNAKESFLGGAGAGVTIQPMAFVAVSNGTARVLQLEPYNDSIDRAIEKVPDVMDKLIALFQKDKGNDKSENKDMTKIEDKPEIAKQTKEEK